MKLLHIDNSTLGQNSFSRQLSAAIVRHVRETHQRRTAIAAATAEVARLAA